MLENVDSCLLPSILPWIVSPRSWCQALHVRIQSTNIFRCIFLQCSIMISLLQITFQSKGAWLQT